MSLFDHSPSAGQPPPGSPPAANPFAQLTVQLPPAPAHLGTAPPIAAPPPPMSPPESGPAWDFSSVVDIRLVTVSRITEGGTQAPLGRVAPNVTLDQVVASFPDSMPLPGGRDVELVGTPVNGAGRDQVALRKYLTITATHPAVLRLHASRGKAEAPRMTGEAAALEFARTQAERADKLQAELIALLKQQLADTEARVQQREIDASNRYAQNTDLDRQAHERRSKMVEDTLGNVHVIMRDSLGEERRRLDAQVQMERDRLAAAERERADRQAREDRERSDRIAREEAREARERQDRLDRQARDEDRAREHALAMEAIRAQSARASEAGLEREALRMKEHQALVINTMRAAPAAQDPIAGVTGLMARYGITFDKAKQFAQTFLGGGAPALGVSIVEAIRDVAKEGIGLARENIHAGADIPGAEGTMPEDEPPPVPERRRVTAAPQTQPAAQHAQTAQPEARHAPAQQSADAGWPAFDEPPPAAQADPWAAAFGPSAAAQTVAPAPRTVATATAPAPVTVPLAPARAAPAPAPAAAPAAVPAAAAPAATGFFGAPSPEQVIAELVDELQGAPSDAWYGPMIAATLRCPALEAYLAEHTLEGALEDAMVEPERIEQIVRWAESTGKYTAAVLRRKG